MNRILDHVFLYQVRAKRDPEAFARLYDRYVTAIYRFVVLKLPSREIAEDLTSETFLRAWRYIQESTTVENPRAFLYKIARNLVADYYRKQEGIPDTVTFSSQDTSSSIEGSLDVASSAQRVMEARADVALILQHLARLKPDYQDVLTLRLIDDLPFSDIAVILGKNSGAVRVLYHRALKALDQLTSSSNHELT